MKKIQISLTIILLISIIWMVFFWSPNKNDLSTKIKGGDFILNSDQGKVSLAELKGKVVLIYFGYTWCPDICPTNLAMMGAAFSELNKSEIKNVQGIFISIDPERDTTKRLAEYTPFFHTNIVGLTGSEEVIKKLAKSYGVSYRKVIQNSKTNYVVDHSSQTYLIDKQGKLVEILEHAAPPETILKNIRHYL